MEFNKIKFGNADAREEGAYEPKLLTNGYFNLNNVVDIIKNPSTFLFLGQKGSGKTALAEHLRLTIDNYSSFIRTILLKDFPYKSFKKIIEGSEEFESKLPKAWNWLILIYVLDSLSDDNGLKRDVDNNFDKTVKRLKEIGISPSENINDIVTKSSKRGFKLSLTEMFKLEYSPITTSDDNEAKFYHLVKHLKTLISKLKSKSYHYIIVDGLDEVLSTRDVTRDIQYISLTALINEAKSLNQFFRNTGLNIKIIIFCRTDLFEKLPDPNKNKIRRDSSYLFHWQPERLEPAQSPLVSIANLRASLTFNKNIDVFDSFFPKTFEGKDIRTYLLQFTRNTPRDFLQLLKFIQEYTVNGKVESNCILTGLSDYSIRYFLPEIKDEMVGYLDIKQIELAVEAMSKIRTSKFTFQEMDRMIAEIDNQGYLSCKDLVSILYECGAIGQFNLGTNGKKIFSFKYRNPHSTVHLTDNFVFHKGLLKSFNIN